MEDNVIAISIAVLGGVAVLAAAILYVVAKKFKVDEDPRIDEVNELLPGANCGGCGFAGCRNFAEACVKAGGTDGLACPVGGEPTMEDVKRILTPSDAEEAAAPAAQEGGEKKGFDPVIAAKIKALATPKASFPNSILMAQKL